MHYTYSFVTFSLLGRSIVFSAAGLIPHSPAAMHATAVAATSQPRLPPPACTPCSLLSEGAATG
jgi:hypothetical protein